MNMVCFYYTAHGNRRKAHISNFRGVISMQRNLMLQVRTLECHVSPCTHCILFVWLIAFIYEKKNTIAKLLGGSISTQNKSVDVLLLAAKIAAARELWEETGLDIRNHLDRLTEAPLKPAKEHELTSELENRIYFYLQLKSDDFTFMVRLIL